MLYVSQLQWVKSSSCVLKCRQPTRCKIWGSHSSDCEDYGLGHLAPSPLVAIYQDFGWKNFIFRTCRVVQKWITRHKMSFQLVLDWLELLQSNWLFSNDNTVLRVITLHCTCGNSNLAKTVVSASGPDSNLVFVCKKCVCSINLSYHQSLCKHD